MCLPYQIAAEQKAEDEDEDRRSKHHDVDVKGQVLKSYIRHPETVVLETRGHGYPPAGERDQRPLIFLYLVKIKNLLARTIV